MAAGPADAFSSTPRGFGGVYDSGGELMGDNLWSSGVVATASTGASWVDEVHNSTTASTSSSSDPAEKRLEEIKRKFHRGRILQIKHLPREVTEEVSKKNILISGLHPRPQFVLSSLSCHSPRITIGRMSRSRRGGFL